MEQKVLIPPVLCSYFINYIEAGKGNGMCIAPVKRYSMAGSSTAVKLEDIPNGFESILAPLNVKPLTYADDFNGSHTLKINKYIVGQEFPPHKDDIVTNYAGSDSRRALRYRTIIFQLSDPSTYKGGDLYIKDKVANRTHGNVIVFPAKDTHWLTKVTEGVRYSMTLWLHKEDFNHKRSIL